MQWRLMAHAHVGILGRHTRISYTQDVPRTHTLHTLTIQHNATQCNTMQHTFWTRLACRHETLQHDAARLYHLSRHEVYTVHSGHVAAWRDVRTDPGLCGRTRVQVGFHGHSVGTRLQPRHWFVFHVHSTCVLLVFLLHVHWCHVVQAPFYKG